MDCKSYLEYVNIKDSLLLFKCNNCNKNHKKLFKEDLSKRSERAYRFRDEVIGRFCLMLQKGIYPYDYSIVNLMKHYCWIRKVFTVS